jgi:uncharacterized small protein (DUF1192 family)
LGVLARTQTDLHKLGVAELQDAVDDLSDRMAAIGAERDKLHAEAMALHEERVPYEEELASRAAVMGATVPRMVLDARTAAGREG